MAINSSYHEENSPVQASYVTYPKESDLALSPLTTHGLDGSMSGSNTKWNKARNSKTPHVSRDQMQLLSYLTQKKDEKKILSSFQLAANIYKSNSDEFKTKKMTKKSNKKSVLTLPNESPVLPQACTVSDMSEYFNDNDKSKTRKSRKRLPLRKKKRHQSPNKDYEYYDKEANYCSQMNVYLDCSSTDVVKNFKGDGRRKTRSNDSETKNDETPNNVWAVLRDINRFQFQPSPPMSDDSIVKPRKNKLSKKKLQRGVYETCRTEQISYFSSIGLNVKSSRDGSLSGSSSIDRITVIDNEDSFNHICKQVHKTFEKKVQQTKAKREKLTKQSKPPNSKRTCRNNCKDLCSPKKFIECQADEVQKQSGMVPRNDASIETLVQEKSESSIKSREKSNEIVERKEYCTQVEIHTKQDLEQQGKAKSGYNSKRDGGYNAITSAETLRNITPNPNKKLRRSLLPPRPPWCNAPLRSSLTPARPLITDNGSTKIIVTPEEDSTLSKLEDNLIASQQGTTVTSTEPRHPLTRSDILRAVSKIKFPLVILGKDQLSGTFQVEDYDFPQFNGLDKHVWPFMRDWSGKTSGLLQSGLRRYNNFAKSRSNYNECNPKINAVPANKKYFSTDFNHPNPNKTEQANTPNKINLEYKQNSVAKLKPILQFRDKMLKLLNRKANQIVEPSQQICNQDNMNTVKLAQINKKCIRSDKNISEMVDASIIKAPLSRLPVQTINQQSTSLPRPTSPSKIQKPQKQPDLKRNWCKSKWGSDFIENVIRKIKNGTYYTNELECKPSKKESLQHKTNTSNTNNLNLQDNGSKEVSIQAAISADFTPKITIQKKKEPLVMLPGFDEVSPQIEIKSMNQNQIAVKHCVMNIVLQFDVNVPLESDQRWTTFKRSISCAPVSVPDSKTKVFKCKARILNALLPEELCSIIPKVMKQFLDKDRHSLVTLQNENKINAVLSPISESTIPQYQEISKPLLPSTETSELRSLKDGRFPNNPKAWRRKPDPYDNIYILAIDDLPYDLQSVDRVLFQKPKINYQDYIAVNPDYPLILESRKGKPTLTSNSSVQNYIPETINLCRDLVPYIRNEIVNGAIGGYAKPQIASPMIIEFCRMINQMKTNYVLESFPSIQMQTHNSNVSLNFSVGNHRVISNSICINVTNLQLGPLYNAMNTYSLNTIAYSCPEKRIEYIKHAEEKEFKVPLKGKHLHNVVINKPKRKGNIAFVKLYKKCKSTSHISSEKRSTSLSKVTNLNEFFQAMGSGKLLSSVFDGGCGKRILSCVSELKNWITEITPRQALLVMLLTNKKDTSNLVRFRPILLQGIAVNRITRVSELDMEIEVIEREKFNKLSEYPGMPSSFKSTQNNDYLLEELYWIAKTTASDYQRRFDESSEKLLKALLEKRKNLNPSYLRVMARYVGLCLLKTPPTKNAL